MKENNLKVIQYRINPSQLKCLRDEYHCLLVKLNENYRIYHALCKQGLDRQLDFLGRLLFTSIVSVGIPFLTSTVNILVFVNRQIAARGLNGPFSGRLWADFLTNYENCKH